MNGPLRFGVLSYVNCLPMTLALEQGEVTDACLSLRRGAPADLNRMMAGGELDVSMVSTAEFLERRCRYQRLVDFSLWCDGWVESVTLFSPYSKTELNHWSTTVLAVTPESATSVALLELLQPQAVTVAFETLEQARADLLESRITQGVLLIGDTALNPPAWTAGLHAHDLGEWWKESTACAMTYAVWVARADLDEERLAMANRLLRASREWGLRLPPELLAEGHRRCGLDEERLRQYFTRLQYVTNTRSAEGLMEFGGRWALNRLIERPPALAGR